MAISAAAASVIGAGITAAANTGSALSIGLGKRKQQKRQFKYNQQLMDRQFDQNKMLMEQQQDYALQNWNMENEYNSPEAQRQRYEQAGLNPALMYQQGDTGNAGSVGGYDSLPVDYSSFNNKVPDNLAQSVAASIGEAGNIMSILSGLVDLDIKAKTADEIESRKRLNDAQADYRAWELGNAPDRWRLDELLGMQNYALRGGDYKREETDEIRNLRMKLLRAELRGLDDEHLMSAVNRSLARSGIKLNKVQLKLLSHKLAWSKDEYDLWKRTEQPYGSLGVFKRPLENIGGHLSNALGEAIGSWLSGSRGLRKSLSKSASRYLRHTDTYNSFNMGKRTYYNYEYD